MTDERDVIERLRASRYENHPRFDQEDEPDVPSWMHERPDTWLGDEQRGDEAADEASERYAREHGRRAEDERDA